MASEQKTIVCNTPSKIEAFRLLSIRGRLQLEVKTGIKFRVNQNNMIREILGVKTRSKIKLLEQFEEHLRKIGVLSAKS